MHLQTRSITASRCITKLAGLQPPSSHDHGLHVHLWTCVITASKCISNLTRSQPQSQSLNSQHYGLQIRMIIASKCISKLARSQPQSASPNSLNHSLQVHRYGVTVGVRRSRGNGSGQSDGVYTSAYPGVGRHHLIIQWQYTLYLPRLLVSLGMSEILWNLTAGLFDIFSPDSYTPQTRIALPHEFCLDVERGGPQCWWWALCLLAPSFHHNDRRVLHPYVLSTGVSEAPLIMLDYHLRADLPYVYIQRDLNDSCHIMM